MEGRIHHRNNGFSFFGSLSFFFSNGSGSEGMIMQGGRIFSHKIVLR